MFDLNKAGKQTDPDDNYTTQSPQDPTEAFINEMAKHGLYPGEIIPDGEIHKFSTKEGDDKDTAGWYVFFEGDICGASFGDWRTLVKGNWCSHMREDMDLRQLRQYDEQMRISAAKQKIAEKEKIAGYDIKAKEAQALLDAAAFYGDVGHSYPDRKQIHADGYKVHVTPGGHKALLIPKYRLSADGKSLELRNVEHIWESPEMPKHGLTGAEPAGLFHILYGRPECRDVYLGEGFSTCMSICMSTGATVVCAFNAGNMPKVAESVKILYPDWNIVVAGDDDLFQKPKPDGTPNNPGRTKALETGKLLNNAPVIFPTFKDLSTKPTDFNDLMVSEGVDAVWDQLYNTVSMMKIEPFFSGPAGNFLAESENGTDEQEFIFSRPGDKKPGGLRVGVIGYAGGEGGCGKTRIWFQIGASIAYGHDFTGGAFDFYETGPFYMVAGEDSRDIMAEISIMIRIRAEENGFQIPTELQSNFYFRCADGGKGSPCLFKRDGGRNLIKTDAFKGLYEDCRNFRPVTLVLDSQSIIVGMGEESNEDAGIISGELKALLKYCMTIVIIAHTNKSSTSGKATATSWERAWPSALSAEALRGSSALVFNGRFLKMTTKVPDRFNEGLGAGRQDRLVACTIPKANGTREVYDPFYFKQRLYSWRNNQGTMSHSVLWDHFEPSMTEAKRLAQEETEAEATEQQRVSKIVIDKIVEMVGQAGGDGHANAGKKASPANLNQLARAMVDISESYALKQYSEVTRATRALEKRFKDSDGIVYTNDLKNVIELIEKTKGSYAHFLIYDPSIERGKDSEIGLFDDHETRTEK